MDEPEGQDATGRLMVALDLADAVMVERVVASVAVGDPEVVDAVVAVVEAGEPSVRVAPWPELRWDELPGV
ncbi:hypothetical protein [Verrucosispora sp. TAA-831]|uniref:hypothetical protein n=1 Tax=Verrucosispora sp. TAA-831 TaxID=3422227 RepID=UPI003D6FCF9D